MKTLAIDMDEVLADVAGKLKKRYSDTFHKQWTAAEIYGKNLKEAIPVEHVPRFHQFLNEPGFFRDLDLMDGAAAVMQELNEKYDLYLVSAAMEFPNSLRDKYDWIMEKLPFISWRQIYLCGVKHIVQTDIIIDDRSRNFKFFRGRKLLYSAHHNLLEEGYERVDNWQQIREKLL